jgi:autotransporter strand-loop-strand O-heptosyltransferase
MKNDFINIDDISENMKAYLEHTEQYEDVPLSGIIFDKDIPSNIDLTEDQFHFNFSLSGARVFIYGDSDNVYDIYMVDNDTNIIRNVFKCKPNNWVASHEDYYVNWRIDIKKEEDNIESMQSFIQNLNDKHVYIKIETSALGDNIAFIPVIEEFRLRHNCKITVSTLYKDYQDLFKPYKYINFVDPTSHVSDVHYRYFIGWYGTGIANKRNKRNCHDISLQQIAGDVLGIEVETEFMFKDVKTTIPVITGEYVIISPFSTAQMKLWNNDKFQEIVDYLNSKAIRTVVIGMGTNYLENVIDYTGKQSLYMLRNLIYHSIYGIYLPSGLSWLSWSMGKNTVMISGISKDHCEFKNLIYRIEPEDKKCFGCFNNSKIIFDKYNWDHCINDEKFICTKQIGFEQVKNVIDSIY